MEKLVFFFFKIYIFSFLSLCFVFGCWKMKQNSPRFSKVWKCFEGDSGISKYSDFSNRGCIYSALGRVCQKGNRKAFSSLLFSSFFLFFNQNILELCSLWRNCGKSFTNKVMIMIHLLLVTWQKNQRTATGTRCPPPSSLCSCSCFLLDAFMK